MTIPPALLIFGLSMLPIVELRGAIPLGVLMKMPIESAFFWAELGNIIIVLLILKLLGPTSEFLIRHSKFFQNFFTKLFAFTRKKHSRKFEKFGTALIVLLTATPLPGTGAWTGALLAFLFDINYFRAVGLIFIGNIVAGMLISFGIGGTLEIFKFLKI